MVLPGTRYIGTVIIAVVLFLFVYQFKSRCVDEVTPIKLGHVGPHNFTNIMHLSSGFAASANKSSSPANVVIISSFHMNVIDDAQLLSTVVEFMHISLRKVRPEILEDNHYFSDILSNPPVHLFIFVDQRQYFSLSNGTKAALDEYCRAHRVGIIGFHHTTRQMQSNKPAFVQVRFIIFENLFFKFGPEYPLLTRSTPQARGFYLAKESRVLTVARRGQGDPTFLRNHLTPCREWQRFPPCVAYLINSTATKLTETDWSVFVPRSPNDVRMFNPVAFTQVGSPGNNPLEKRSCANNVDIKNS